MAALAVRETLIVLLLGRGERVGDQTTGGLDGRGKQHQKYCWLLIASDGLSLWQGRDKHDR